MRVLTYNVQNLRLRRPGGRNRLDGARDFDDPESDERALDFADRRLTADVLAQADADICALQEVFDAASLTYFHDHLLRATRVELWPWKTCLAGNDGAGRDVAVLSRRPFAATSHARVMPQDLGLSDLPGARTDRPVFCRDCLSVDLGAVTLFVVHFKAPWPDRQIAWQQRRIEALAVRRLIERQFEAPERAMWLILGDLNDPLNDPERAVAPLLDGFAVDLTERMPEGERWTWWHPDGLKGCPDAMLASPALAARWPDAVPRTIRAGLGREAGGANPRYADVGDHRPHASDHAALYLDLPGL